MEKKTPSLAPRLTTEIKQFFKTEFNLTVSAHKGLSKNPFYRVNAGHYQDGTPKFPLEVRIGLLRAIYGEKEWIQSGAAGNIMPHSMAFHEKEWHAFKAEYLNSKNIPA